MQCPMCGGPLHLRDPGHFACERGHALDGQELQQAASTRVTMAFWMAIEALQSEADALRTLGGSVDGGAALADQAERDAEVLRDLAMAHTRLRGDDERDGSKNRAR